MDSTSLVRLRWRLRGAWLWPSFVVLTLVDAAIVTELPPIGDGASFVGGWLAGIIISLLAILALSVPLAYLIRRLASGMPMLVARNYAGAVITLAVTCALLAAGLVHSRVVRADQSALADATARAEAYIGDHAPAAFQADLRSLDVYELQPPEIYRTCATAAGGTRHYCVVVNRGKPFGASVTYAGSEPNSLISQGT